MTTPDYEVPFFPDDEYRRFIRLRRQIVTDDEYYRLPRTTALALSGRVWRQVESENERRP